MNIWLNTTPPSQHAINVSASICKTDESCPNDNDTSIDKGRIGLSILNALALLEVNIRHLYMHTFVCPETLHVQHLQDSLWLVCNPLGQGNVAVLDTEAYALLTSFHSPKMLQDVIEGESTHFSRAAKAIALFIMLGILRDLDQPASIVEQPQQSAFLSAWLHVTNACNLGCHYCYVSKSSEHMAEDISKRAVDAVIRSAIQQHYRGIHLTYAGGEATLRLPQVIAIHDYALQQAQEHRLDLSAGMISNGAALPPRYIEQLKQRHIGLAISLDGVGEQHDQQRPLVNGQGSFTFVDRTITRLLAHGLTPNINVTVSQRNLEHLPQLLAYLLQRELPFGLSYYRENDCSVHLSNLQFTDDQMISGMRTAFSYIEEHLPRRPLLGALVDKAKMGAPHQHACGVGRNYMVINQRGGIAKCQVDITRAVTTIDAENPLRVIREDRRGVQAVPVDEKEGCQSCEWRYWCSGGCPMLTYRLTGRSDIKSPNCAIYKTLFPEALRLEALRLLKYETPIIL